MLSRVIFVATFIFIPAVMLQGKPSAEKMDGPLDPDISNLPNEVQKDFHGDYKEGFVDKVFNEDKVKLPSERKKRYVRVVAKGAKFLVTISKTGVKWLWVKTKNGFKRLGRALDFLDRWYMLGPMLFLEPEEVDPEYYHYEEYDEEALAAEEGQ